MVQNSKGCKDGSSANFTAFSLSISIGSKSMALMQADLYVSVFRLDLFCGVQGAIGAD